MDKAANGRILIVESDKFMRILLEKLCTNIYHVKTLENGEKALEWLEEQKADEKPWVIVSNQVMPNMKGTDFLRKSQDLSPDSVKILLTAEEQTKEIVTAMKEANAFIFQPKPFQNLPLMQSIKVAVDKYKSRLTIRKLTHSNNNLKSQVQQYTDKLKEYQRHIKNLKEGNQNKSESTMDLGFYKFISFLATNSERWYFTPHTKEVVALAGYLARHMELSKDKINTVTLASMLHNAYALVMPPRLQIHQPFSEAHREELHKEFMAYYYKFYEQLSSIDGIGEIGKIACMIWEKYDGTGFPEAIGGMNFPVTGQVLAISNLYHDMVYKVRKEHVEQLKTEGILKQPYEETMSRHNEAIAFMFKHVKWFDQDLLNLFKNSARRGACKQLQPRKETLIIEFNKNDYLVSGAKLSSKEQYDMAKAEERKRHVTVLDDEGNEQAKTIELIKLENLKPDMVLNDDIQTEGGNTVVKKGTALTEDLIGKLMAMKEEGSLKGVTSIIYDDDESLDRDDEADPWGSKDMLVE